MLRLLVALDFSDCSRAALQAALSVAEKATPAELVVITVLPRMGDDAQTEGALNEMESAVTQLHKMVEAAFADRQGVKVPQNIKIHYSATRGSAADEIIQQALSHHVDAIVMGTHGRTGMARLIAGSVAETVVRHAPCSVLTVKPKKTA